MKTFLIVLSTVALLFAIVLLLSYICFRIVFFVPHKKKASTEEFPIPHGSIYEPHREAMIKWMKETRSLPRTEFTITSFDGLKLHGKYYECSKGAPIEIMFHGYRGNAERDLCGGAQRCFALGRNALIVDQRTSCNSDGNVITFGIHEHRDCVSWVDFVVQHFGPDIKIILTGMSMGASTVLMAAGCQLPKNVVGILADCGYSSARDIIRKCIHQLHLPIYPVYPLIKLGATLWGHFDLEEYSPVDAMKKCQIPVIFFHGEDDDFVPCEMSRINYDACNAKKKLITIPGAGHGLSYIIDSEKYLEALSEFFAS